ncbi:hypothetical protein BJ878DRAFT_102768 [Calycina marina]|uniref:Shugoshin n=1 Tax=Calycina marina TaxID=1763456 RepID=A0A9P8CFX4_9HELO|nr:hypothetical protein BJ878DRAFT_102768 [Calycina marina]
MARLNEPPAPVETMESLKRKFMRQNRDIARANSTQSMRIRNLENETSRLLADNLGLREQILRLQLEIDDGKSRRIADNTKIIKSQLEEKMLEISALINDLSWAPTPERRKSRSGKLCRSSAASPDQRKWKLMSEEAAAQEGRLPPILENKSFPRKTLEQQEIQTILDDAAANTTDSPEIGPPPVSQFVNEDPVKIDLPSRPKDSGAEDFPENDPPLSIHLEHRKKRKDSIGDAELRRGGRDESKEVTSSFKVGAKRKLSVRDDEEGEPPTKRDENVPDFQFTRSSGSETTNRPESSAPSGKRIVKVSKAAPLTRAAPREKPIVNSVSIAARKALAPKSVNNSPRKTPRTGFNDMKAAKTDQIKSDPIEEKPLEEKGVKTAVFPDTVESEPVVEVILGDLQPETSANLDLFSPFESQPSTARPESRDTPPPPDLGSGSDANRPSRRARAAVSYAEPSLRDKMRRPTKELVDAVMANAKLHCNSIKLEGLALADGARVKTESESDDVWKSMPAPSATTVENSPLSSKVQVTEALPSSITTHRKRRESLLNQVEMNKSLDSSSTLAALLASTKKIRDEAKERNLINENLPPKDTGTDIYEFRGSPPRVIEATLQPAKTERASSRFARRHTTITRDTAPTEDSEASDIEGPKRSESIISRRRQSTIAPRSNSSASGSSVNLNDYEKPLKKSTSITAMAGAGHDIGSRSDRIAARRRSMML